MSRAFSMRRRRFVHLAVPGLLGLCTTLALGSCGTQNQPAATSTSEITAAEANPANIKTKVLQMGYQQAGDLVRVTKVLEKTIGTFGREGEMGTICPKSATHGSHERRQN